MTAPADTPRGPTATELRNQALAAAWWRPPVPVPAEVSWRHSIFCAIHNGQPCNCKEDT